MKIIPKFIVSILVLVSFSRAYALVPLFNQSSFLKENKMMIMAADINYKEGPEFDEVKKAIGREGSCNHNIWLEEKYAYLIHGYNIGEVKLNFSSQEFALLGQDGNYYDFREDKLKSEKDNFLTLKHNKAIGRFVVFGDRNEIKWNKGKILKKFTSSCVRPPKKNKLEYPSQEQINYEQLDLKKIGKLKKSNIKYYEVDGIPEKVFYAKYNYNGLGSVWQVGLTTGKTCTILNQFSDSGDLKGYEKGGVNAQGFHGVMEIGPKEKWLVFEAEGWEWWGYSMIPYNGGKPVKMEKRETVFYDGL